MEEMPLRNVCLETQSRRPTTGLPIGSLVTYNGRDSLIASLKKVAS
jgi:hypothetical protein